MTKKPRGLQEAPACQGHSIAYEDLTKYACRRKTFHSSGYCIQHRHQHPDSVSQNSEPQAQPSQPS